MKIIDIIIQSSKKNETEPASFCFEGKNLLTQLDTLAEQIISNNFENITNFPSILKIIDTMIQSLKKNETELASCCFEGKNLLTQLDTLVKQIIPNNFKSIANFPNTEAQTSINIQDAQGIEIAKTIFYQSGFKFFKILNVEDRFFDNKPISECRFLVPKTKSEDLKYSIELEHLRIEQSKNEIDKINDKLSSNYLNYARNEKKLSEYSKKLQKHTANLKQDQEKILDLEKTISLSFMQAQKILEKDNNELMARKAELEKDIIKAQKQLTILVQQKNDIDMAIFVLNDPGFKNYVRSVPSWWPREDFNFFELLNSQFLKTDNTTLVKKNCSINELMEKQIEPLLYELAVRAGYDAYKAEDLYSKMQKEGGCINEFRDKINTAQKRRRTIYLLASISVFFPPLFFSLIITWCRELNKLNKLIVTCEQKKQDAIKRRSELNGELCTIQQKPAIESNDTQTLAEMTKDEFRQSDQCIKLEQFKKKNHDRVIKKLIELVVCHLDRIEKNEKGLSLFDGKSKQELKKILAVLKARAHNSYVENQKQSGIIDEDMAQLFKIHSQQQLEKLTGIKFTVQQNRALALRRIQSEIISRPKPTEPGHSRATSNVTASDVEKALEATDGLRSSQSTPAVGCLSAIGTFCADQAGNDVVTQRNHNTRVFVR